MRFVLNDPDIDGDLNMGYVCLCEGIHFTLKIKVGPSLDVPTTSKCANDFDMLNWMRTSGLDILSDTI